MTIKNTRIEVWELPPGASEGSHVHEGNDTLEEFYYFIAGRGRRKTPAMRPPVPIATNWPTTDPPAPENAAETATSACGRRRGLGGCGSSVHGGMVAPKRRSSAYAKTSKITRIGFRREIMITQNASGTDRVGADAKLRPWLTNLAFIREG